MLDAWIMMSKTSGFQLAKAQGVARHKYEVGTSGLLFVGNQFCGVAGPNQKGGL